MTEPTPGFRLDHRTLAALAREVEDADPIAWGATALDRGTVYDLIASQIAEVFRDYETAGVPRERQMVIALATVVKLAVENFVLHQELITAVARRRSLRLTAATLTRAGVPGSAPCRREAARG